MPAIPETFEEPLGFPGPIIPDATIDGPPTLVKRVYIPYTSTLAPPGLIEAETVDPWSASGKYALGWVYMCLIIFIFAILLHLKNIWRDKIRTAWHKEKNNVSIWPSDQMHYEMPQLDSDKSTTKLFPRLREAPQGLNEKSETTVSDLALVNNIITIFRYVFYRPIRPLVIKKGWRPITPPSLAVIVLLSIAVIFSVLYCFVPQPLYWESIKFGSPPVAIRAGMIAVAMVPWLIGLSMKANLISFMTGIGHERLNVLHRWGGWLCLFLALVHTVPFYIQPITGPGGHRVFKTFFQQGIYYYGSGWAALAPLIVLCLHSLPVLRHRLYELFVAVHVPIAIIFFGMMFWHCNNYLTSWNYLLATLAIWLLSYFARLAFYLNWTHWWKLSWLIGDEASVHLLSENAIKVTVATKRSWRPGQYVYLRLPGISVFENHPFTIASLCSDDFPSDYGEDYRDMVLVFRPFGGFTNKVLNTALAKGPWHSYRAFIDGPYGGMQRSLDAFDHVVLFAGGSGITALVSHLLNLIKRMRDGKAVTKSVHIVWALKRPEVMDWFREELRICRENAPPGSVTCQFYITAAKRLPETGQIVSVNTPSRVVSHFFHDKVNNAFQDIANKRQSHYSEYSRHSALIRDEAEGDPDREKELREEREDHISALPQAHVFTPRAAPANMTLPITAPVRSIQDKRRSGNLHLDLAAAIEAGTLDQQHAQDSFNFGFPSTPTEFQKNLMRFAFLPAAVKKKDGWSTEYGRPDVPFMLRQMSKEFGKRTCVFVCGPPSMRCDVAQTVAELQLDILRDSSKEELFLHTENYAI